MRNLVLVGLMGSGKTTIGKNLAKKLDLNFIDTDDLIEQRWEMNIGKIIAMKGEPFYRDQETGALKYLLGRQDVVISTGGGRLDEESWQTMRMLGLIVYISTTSRELASHLDLSRHGIWIGSPDPGLVLEKVRQMLMARHHEYYRADLVVEAESMTSADICDYIKQLISEPLQDQNQ